MATTTNYSWTTPDDTALVKDGAAAIRTLGSSIDTTTKALNPSTTLGDIEYRSSTANTNTRLPIGSSGQVLTVVAGVPSWSTGFTNPLTTTGDLIYSSSGSTAARLGIGSSGQALIVSGGLPSWGNAGGMTLISNSNVSGSTNISFSSISGSYKQLYLYWNNVSVSSSSGVWSLRFNNDSGANYDISRIVTTSSVSTANIDGADSIAEIIYGGGSSSPQHGFIMIDNYSSNSQRRFFEGQWVNNETPKGYVVVGQYDNTSTAITSLDIVRTGGTTTISGTFRLYGVA